MIWLLAAVCAVAAIYQLLAIAGCLWHLWRRHPAASQFPPISVLKPVYRPGPELPGAVRSHVEQDYPEFEVLLGARGIVPEVPGARVIVTHTETPNRKVGTLVDLVAEARHSIVVVNDADIRVPAGYLRVIAAELEPPEVGLVTCLYRAEARTFAGRWEALGIATDFAPSTLVAPFVGVSEFGLGATLAFRRVDLERIGGYGAVGDYLADDYQLGAKLHALGRRNVIARVVVSTSLGAPSWKDVWRHQVRWARTVRLSSGGYIGLPVTFATFWAAVAAAFGAWWLAAPLLAVRFAMALTAGWGVLRCPEALRLALLIPFRDLYAAAVWAAALGGNTVEWAGEILELDKQGRIVGRRVSPLRSR
ncbi:MAG TPA: glycosyltransferase [Bryobacteraceae bacterium]|nr:glycosyltransferase [Bryobacteraceae bacterium]